MAIRRARAILAPNQRNEIRDCEAGGEIPRSRKRSKFVRRLIGLACLGILVADTTGCTITRGTVNALKNSDCVETFMVGYRNRAMAEKAWHCRKHRFGNQLYGHEYKEGFVDGYIEIAEGGYGCCPKIAPARYWGWKYQTATGRQAVNAWFEGYPMGVQAAEQDGIGHWGRIQTMGDPTGTATGSSCNSCGSGVVDPLYTTPEMMPAETGPGSTVPDGGEIEMVIPPAPNAASGGPVRPGLPSGAPEYIASRELSSGLGLIDTQSVEPNELELRPSAPASDGLPFTFE